MHTTASLSTAAAPRAGVRSPAAERPQRLRCPNCRTRRTDAHSMFLHLVHCKQEDCRCGGYHFKHRRGSPLCDANPLSALRLAERCGASEEELLDLSVEIAFTSRGHAWHPGEPIPI